MTMIVVLRGTDGLVMAADEALSDRIDNGAHRQSLAKKILYNPAKPWWACAGAGQRGSVVAQQAIRDLCDSMTTDERMDDWRFRKELEQIGNKAWEATCDAQQDKPDNNVRDNCLVLYKDCRSNLYIFRLQIARHSTVNQISYIDIIGDHGNPAAYFAQHYRPDGKSIRDLKLLAGMTVLAGHRFNSAGINGLDILLFPEKGVPEFSHEDSDSALQVRVREINERIKAELFR